MHSGTRQDLFFKVIWMTFIPLRVYTPAAIWGEWLACAPAIMFLCISITNRENFNRDDISLVIGVFLSVLFGFFMIPDQPYWLACIWLFVSCALYVWVCYLVSRTQRELSLSIREAEMNNDVFEIELCHFRRKSKLCAAFLYVVSLHVLVYLVAMTKVIDHNFTLIGLLLSDVSSKLLVTVAATEEHAEVMNPLALHLIREKSANEAKRQFLRYIFHEVRVPLNTVTMGIEFLSKSENLKEEIDTVEMMNEATHFMSETINGAQTMQKVEEGKLELHMEPFLIVERLLTMTRTFEGTAKAKDVCIKRDIRIDPSVVVIGDRFQLDHVTANFLSNAIKFSKPHSTITVIIEEKGIDCSSCGKREISVRVRDEGPGISKEDIAKLFTPFMQIRPGELQRGRGSGIGLSICKQIVTLHGGEIECESEVGVGSVFSHTVRFQEVAPNVVPEATTVYDGGIDGGGARMRKLDSNRWESVIAGPSTIGVSLLGDQRSVAGDQDFSGIGDVLVVDGRSDSMDLLIRRS